MSQAELLETIEAKYATLCPYMDERTRRIWAAVEARSMGWGGVSRVAEATGMSRATIYAGVQELESLSQLPNEVARITQTEMLSFNRLPHVCNSNKKQGNR